MGGLGGGRPNAVARLAPVALSLASSLLLPVAGASPAAADPPSPVQAKAAALTARVRGDAARIHQLTEELDQARLQVSSTSARLAGVRTQHEATVQVMSANRAVLLEQAVRAYMHGGVAPGMPTAAATADMTLSREYLRVASGDLADTGDRLRQLEAGLRGDEATLRGAQRANVLATTQLQLVRADALSIAAKKQAQLDSLQAQLALQAPAAAPAGAAAAPGLLSPLRAAQGAPVNNGLVSVVQQAAGLPIATPVSTSVTTATPTPAAPSSTGGGGHAGGVWLSLRQCESSDNYAENSGNGFFGAYQFSQSTWTGLGFPGRPDQASPAMQDEAAMKLQAESGWGQWPACSAALGLG